MIEAKFKIGDRVTVWKSKLTGTVTAVYYNANPSSPVYAVDVGEPAVELHFGDELKLVPEKKDYSMTIQIDVASNVVIATLFEVASPNMRPIAKGHGHLIHEGANGVAQAASYACKKLYENLGGTITKRGSWK